MSVNFLFDLNKCTGCNACQLACAIENDVALSTNWRQVITFNPHHVPQLPTYHLSLACNHCEDAPCEKYCPARAFERNDSSGILQINSTKCIGCKYCSWICPYDAPQFNAARKIMEKCHFCYHRLDEGLKPACVSLCPTDALQITESPGMTNIPIRLDGFPEVGIKPKIKIIPIRNGFKAPEQSATTKVDLKIVQKFYQDFNPAKTPKLELGSEWGLLVFSLFSALLFGMLCAFHFGFIALNSFFFSTVAMLGIGLSSLHLGKKGRAFRALLNWRHSWLSREILFFLIFIAVSNIYLFHPEPSATLGWSAIIIGLCLLFSIDKVYLLIPQLNQIPFHSASVILTGLFFSAIFIQNGRIISILSLIKAGLYIFRKYQFLKQRKQVRPVMSFLRLAGYLSLFIFSRFPLFSMAGLGAFLVILVAEIIDRAEFYQELDLLTPQKQMERDWQLKLIR